MNINRKKLVRWLKIILVAYVAGGFLLYYCQDLMLFHPEIRDGKEKYDFALPHRDVNLAYSATANLNIIQFTTRDSAARGVVLYFHGNKKNIAWYAAYATSFTAQGYEVWMIDYPGFGKSTGKITEQLLYDYSLTLYKLARAKFTTAQIIIYGKSLGTGIAAWLASKRDCRRLILETPYYSMQSLAAHYFPVYPVSLLIHYKLPTYEYLPGVLAPISILHGDKDGIIPYQNAVKLKPLLKKGDEFISIPGGSHNDLSNFPLFHEKLDSLLRTA